MAVADIFRLARLGLVASCGLVALASGPSVAQSNAVRPFSESERSQGAEAHTQIMQEFGGDYTGAAGDYVRMVGQNVAVQSGLSSNRTDFTVTLLNSPVNNAFALPGGYIYCTRQLFSLMNNEAELAGVLGHELGHTAARHAQQRQRRATRNSILGVLATVLGGAIGDNGGLLGGLGGLLQNNAMQAAQLATLGFSRSQETQADDLGIRYMAAAGYDPAALATVLASLDAQNTLDARVSGDETARNIPAWASTHPDPASRVRRAAERARTMNVVNGRQNREQFLNAVNNVLYADDPRQGVIEGRQFLHPDLRLAFSVPQGFAVSNGTSAVSINGANGQAQFKAGAYNGDLEGYVRQSFQAIVGQNQGNVQLGPIARTSVNGIPAAYAQARATTQQGALDLIIFAYAFDSSHAYHFAALAPVGRLNAFDSLFTSVRRLSAREAAGIRPRRVSVVTARRGDTLQGLANRMAYSDFQMDRFLVLNGFNATATVTPGQRVKIITFASN